jgi:hypothetical protein
MLPKSSLEDYLKGRNLFSARDTHILSSAQCCILPNDSDFCVEMYNYQSTKENPAVLVILVTESGITEHVLTESDRGVFKLLFNVKGDQSYLHIDNKCENGVVKTSHSELNKKEREKNLVRVFQIPLMVPKSQQQLQFMNPCAFTTGGYEEECDYLMEKCSSSKSYTARGGLSMGQVSVGSVYGKYTPPKSDLKRDDSMPIRCTFQYYRVSSGNPDISEAEAEDIATQLRRMSVVETARSSLVEDASTGRPTESDKKHFAPENINDTEFASSR